MCFKWMNPPTLLLLLKTQSTSHLMSSSDAADHPCPSGWPHISSGQWRCVIHLQQLQVKPTWCLQLRRCTLVTNRVALNMLQSLTNGKWINHNIIKHPRHACFQCARHAFLPGQLLLMQYFCSDDKTASWWSSVDPAIKSTSPWFCFRTSALWNTPT